MEASAEELVVRHHNGDEASAMLDVLCDVYADAYGIGAADRVDPFRQRAGHAFSKPGFDLVTGELGGDLVGFVFGYTLQSIHGWWEGLEPERPAAFTEETGSRTAVLSEIEVRERLQRQGIGKLLQHEFLLPRPEERATLATGADVPSQHVYPRWGWTKVGTVPGKPGAYYSLYYRFVRQIRAEGR